MTNYELEEADLIKVQIILSFILLFTTIISILLSYNFLLNSEDKEGFYNDEDSFNILIFNRTVMLIVSLIFIYINIRDKDVKEKYSLDDEFTDLQIWSSIFNFMATLIAFYIAVKSITSYKNSTI